MDAAQSDYTNLRNDLANIGKYNILGTTTSPTDIFVTEVNFSKYREIFININYGAAGAEDYAVMTIPVSILKDFANVSYYPSYHNGTALFKGHFKYEGNTSFSYSAPQGHGITVVGIY